MFHDMFMFINFRNCCDINSVKKYSSRKERNVIKSCLFEAYEKKILVFTCLYDVLNGYLLLIFDQCFLCFLFLVQSEVLI